MNELFSYKKYHTFNQISKYRYTNLSNQTAFFVYLMELNKFKTIENIIIYTSFVKIQTLNMSGMKIKLYQFKFNVQIKQQILFVKIKIKKQSKQIN
ncbi:unnamed protein product [Paramecium sonneborni]|uniref:Uncharacterized protein n=1 Tax=Paramecium sonneborni TaxID=65129 RepID=A0A8S1R4B5_9CILI|nr:unnamed protein product [Paramecium sonneborni]